MTRFALPPADPSALTASTASTGGTVDARRRILLKAAPAALAAGWLPSPRAATYPDKPLRLVVPFAAGGPVDAIARLLSRQMGGSLGQPVIVENRPGAGGVIGLGQVTSAPADGYTMVLSSIQFVTNPALMPSVPYVADKDFAPVTVVGFIPHVLVVRADSPARTLQELVAQARRAGGSMSYGSSGAGTSAHLAGALFADRAGIQVVHAPYRGASPAVTDLLGGQIHFMFLDTPTALPYLRGGKLRALAVAPASGAKVLPDVPTVAACGYPGFDIHAWYGMLVRAGTPAPVQQRLYDEIRTALQSPAGTQYLHEQGIDPGGMPPADFGALIRKDLASWQDVVHRLHITLS
ncbi:tripartite tricarboxylate transporter substrate binding protein [Cupriavidus lacunae]|uniref:Tripartite tricarboxylate transporter substrate binding protein n=1 Tax=Cupriavidus lacunae TaxID=2666307 RepID=A0A370NH62_9BURK|nr:tripartite tricarboxylate transporter substrate binding protein [Cupriavidus lacunae]RDK04934.1 tripartite tricarboxylate transporter substrate binding protein [Cupriavidus lacunae]